MQFTAIVVFAIVWGGLMIYFLTPFHGKIERNPDDTFTKALKVSMARLILHKKAILAFLLLLVTLMNIRSYFISAEEYDRLHAITRESGNPVIYMVSVVLYAALLYLLLAVRWAVKSAK
ncbi:hypothetical protein J7I80_11055 [Bacillus sp. ISL-41]|uniref:hypothetical protein n=1 Tax=Bacillus sp. ISL-41 TaxID=2819127 RepID=UPI001BE9119B|nr:hypothetical protein [Bacillus sp. ISL-41]MBT2642767.1 hypothetical protein [Bacillus sp. ISL-41]